jgi:transposase
LNNPEVFNYNTANWTCPLLKEHILKTYQVDYKLAAVYNLMKKLGFSFQRAKSYYPERDEKKRNEVQIDIKKLLIIVQNIMILLCYLRMSSV